MLFLLIEIECSDVTNRYIQKLFIARICKLAKLIRECKQIVEYQKRKSCFTSLLITRPLYSLSASNQLTELSFRNDVIKIQGL